MVIMEDKQQQLIGLFASLLPKETVLDTSVKGLSLFRIDKSFHRSPYSYNSEIIFLAQGSKKVYLGDAVYTYEPSQYLVLPVPLPAECEGWVQPGKPILGLTLAIDPLEVGELLLAIDGKKEPSVLPRGIFSAPVEEALLDAVTRLLRALPDPSDRKVLVPLIKREILYRVLQGKNGEILQSLAHRNRRFFQIAKVLRRIHDRYDADFDMDSLAQELEMSNSTFHNSFKAVTETSPLQYIKNVRLHKARVFMIQDGLNANLASLKVGYESASQFNREYKRLFGDTPAHVASVIRKRNRDSA